MNTSDTPISDAAQDEAQNIVAEQQREERRRNNSVETVVVPLSVARELERELNACKLAYTDAFNEGQKHATDTITKMLRESNERLAGLNSGELELVKLPGSPPFEPPMAQKSTCSTERDQWKAVAQKLAASLEHMDYCGICAENWQDCNGGIAAQDALSEFNALNK